MIDHTKRRTLQTAVVGASSVLGIDTLYAQEASTKPISIVFPFGAGGALDALVRAMAGHLAEELQTPVIVENKPGASSMIGAQYVARAPKDGRTLLWGAWLTFVTAYDLFKDIKITRADFAPITTTVQGQVGVAVSDSYPAANFAELIANIRKTGGVLEYGCVGAGTSPHLMMELAQDKAKDVKLGLVLYKNEQAGLFDLLGGHLKMFVGSLANMEPLQRKGLKVIAVSGDRRLDKFPTTPTFREVGYPELEFTYWHGLAAPAGTPAATVARLADAVARAMAKPDIKEKLSVDQSVLTMRPDEFSALITAHSNKWGSIIRQKNISVT